MNEFKKIVIQLILNIGIFMPFAYASNMIAENHGLTAIFLVSIGIAISGDVALRISDKC